MIGIDRGDEPEALARERERQLALAELGGAPKRRDDIKGYDLPAVREQLCERQHEKCAYCERGIEQCGYPIEHFRPKLGMKDVAWDQRQSDEPPLDGDDIPWGPSDSTRYYWLAWTWENLFYSCQACNSQTHKGNLFPLERGSSRLSKMDLAPGTERSLLINPAEVDPLEHIRFIADPIGEDNWRAVGLTPGGKWTVFVFGLNRPGLRTARRNRVRAIKCNDSLGRALDALKAGDGGTLQAHWKLAVAELLGSTQDFLSLAYCVLDDLVPEATRTKYGLELPKPGSIVKRGLSPLFRPRPELEGLTSPLQMRVRALCGRAPTRMEMDELLVSLCQERPSTLEQLCKVMNRTPEYLKQGYLERLCKGESPRLRWDSGAGQYIST
jgi:hypothetical protein